MELIMLPIIAMYLIQAFLILMGVFFLIGLICTIVGVVKMATSYECYEVKPLTKEAKEWKKKVDKTKGQPYKDLKKSILRDKEVKKYYDQERNKNHSKKVAKHIRVK